MKGLSELGATLTGVAQALVTSTQQARVHRAMCVHWGYTRTAAHLEKTLQALSCALDESLLALLAAETTPDLQSLGRLNVGQTVEEIFQSERRMAAEVRDLALAVLRTTPVADAPARKALESAVTLCAQHVAQFDQGLELIRQMGIQNFLATRC
ncbi:MAG: hypothetical protein IOD12_05570 [Silvanigrellales bacterium]|nr:hypothetical protein [Silvanigrellales bacterium]